MKFKKIFDSEDRRRRRIAKQAMEEMRRLSETRYPFALLFDKTNPLSVERKMGESWPEAFARGFGGLTVPQLRDYLSGVMDTGYYRVGDSDGKTATARELRNYFVGVAAMLVETERELARANDLLPLSP